MTDESKKPTAAAPAAAGKTGAAPKPGAGGGVRPPGRSFRTGGGAGAGGGRGGGAGAGGRGRGGDRGGRRRPDADVPAESDYEEKNVEVSRVTRVTKGGKRMRFRVLSVIGNHKGRAGFGLAKGLDVAAATSKATTKARKSLITVPLVHDTIPHPVLAKFAAAIVLLKPAPRGTGIKAGGPVRVVLELAGVPNVSAKILGSKNKVNNVNAVFAALKMLVAPPVKPGQAETDPSAKSAVEPKAKV